MKTSRQLRREYANTSTKDLIVLQNRLEREQFKRQQLALEIGVPINSFAAASTSRTLHAITRILNERGHGNSDPSDLTPVPPKNSTPFTRLAHTLNPCTSTPTMSNVRSKEQKILDALQHGTFYTICVGNYHGQLLHLRVPYDVTVTKDNLVIYEAQSKGDMEPSRHGTLDHPIYDIMQVTEVHDTPSREATRWIIQVIDTTEHDQRVENEKLALDKIQNVELETEKQAVVERYGEDITKLLGIQNPSNALTHHDDETVRINDNETPT